MMLFKHPKIKCVVFDLNAFILKFSRAPVAQDVLRLVEKDFSCLFLFDLKIVH